MPPTRSTRLASAASKTEVGEHNKNFAKKPHEVSALDLVDNEKPLEVFSGKGEREHQIVCIERQFKIY